MDNKFVLSPSFNDIVFENRNKKYGAYEIRQKYTRYTIIAVICAILFFTCGSLTWAYVQRPDEVHNWRILDMDMTPPGLPPIDDKVDPKPEEPKPQPDMPKTTTADLGPKTADITSEIDITPEDVTPPPGNLEAGKDPNGIAGGIGTGTREPGCIDCKPALDTFVPPAKPPVVWCPFPPTCAGLDEHLTKNIRYPQICRENNIEGTVYVEFIVDTKGNYRDVHVVKGAHPALNKEALRVMSVMPSWTPAKEENGELVEFIMRKPITFQLAK
jgi:periplasmic protein TonB